MNNPQLFIVPIDRQMVVSLGTVCNHLHSTHDLSFESLDSIQHAFIVALAEYWIMSDWTGLEFFLECLKELEDGMLKSLCEVMIRQMADGDVRYYPRMRDGIYSLKDETKYITRGFYIQEGKVDARSRALAVTISYAK